MADKGIPAQTTREAASPDLAPFDPVPSGSALPDFALPDPAQRPCRVSGILFDHQDSPANPETVTAGCSALLVRHLCHFADWTTTDWKVGDHNAYGLTTICEDGLELHLVLASEPMEDVRWRLSACRAGKGALFDRKRRDHLRRFGFAPAGDGLGWERDIRIASTQDAFNTARDLLALLTEIFGFCGTAPLIFTLTLGQAPSTAYCISRLPLMTCVNSFTAGAIALKLAPHRPATP